MRLLFIRWHPSQRVGGLAVNTEQLMEALVRRGHTVGELTARFPALVRPAVERSARLVAGRWPPALRHEGGVARHRAVVPEGAIRGVLASFAPDAVVVSSGGAWRVAWAQAMLDAVAPLPTVLYVYDIASSGLGGSAGDRPPAIAAISSWVAGPLRERGVAVEVILPVVERARYRVATTREAVLFVNPTEAKGRGVAVALAEARPDIPVRFVGGSAKPGRRAPLPRNVTAVPWAAELNTELARARLLLVPSRYPEAWPRVVGEAQASGIPALAAEVGGMREAVGRGGVLLPPEAGPSRWLEALGSIWDDAGVYAELSRLAELEGRRPELSPDGAAAQLEAVIVRAGG